MSLHGTEREAGNAFQSALVELLGDVRPLVCQAHGHDVEAGMLERGDGGTFIFLVNWDHRDATVDVGVRMRPGTYRVTKYSLPGRSQAELDGATKISAEALQSFRTHLEAHETAILTLLP